MQRQTRGRCPGFEVGSGISAKRSSFAPPPAFDIFPTRKDEHRHQRNPRYRHAGGGYHDARHSNAAAQKRGPWCRLWRRGNREYFRSANDQRANEIHRLAGWDFFRSDLCSWYPLRTTQRQRQQFASPVDGTAGGNITSRFASSGCWLAGNFAQYSTRYDPECFSLLNRQAIRSRSRGRSATKRNSFSFGNAKCVASAITVTRA